MPQTFTGKTFTVLSTNLPKVQLRLHALGATHLLTEAQGEGRVDVNVYDCTPRIEHELVPFVVPPPPPAL